MGPIFGRIMKKISVRISGMLHLTLSMRRRLKDQRGQSLIMIGITLLVFMGFATVGVDTGYLVHTMNEMHVVADTAATAGVATYFSDPAAGGGQTDLAEGDALVVGRQNTVNGHLAGDDDFFVTTGNLANNVY